MSTLPNPERHPLHLTPGTPKLPPQNLEAEQGVFGAILQDNEVIPIVLTIVQARDFFRDAHQVIFRAVVHLYESGVAVDCITLHEELTKRDQVHAIGGDTYLGQLLTSVPHAANAKFHAEIVREKSLSRATIELGQEMVRDGHSGKYTSEELWQRASERIVEVPTGPGLIEIEDDLGPRPWPDPLDNAAYHGVAGELVRLIEPHTEADPVAILIQFLVGVGSMIGRRPRFRHEQTWHHSNLFCCIVGNSATARKGTSWDHVRAILGTCDPDWKARGLDSGLSSGEGLIWSVRDPVHRREKVNGRQGGGVGGYQEIEVDPGIDDKRKLFVETEFGGTLSQLTRDGNTLETVMRQAFDSGDLRSTTKNNLARATGAHISVAAHITCEELHRRLPETSAVNGFANRFMWVCARRSKKLPHGGKIHTVDFGDVVRQLSAAAWWATNAFPDEEGIRCGRSTEANEVWEQAYDALSEAKPGLLGAVLNRSLPLSMRLAMIYAILDRTEVISAAHLRAGLAVWKYCEQSVGYIFGERLGDNLAERIHAYLKAKGKPCSRNQIKRDLSGGHFDADTIERALLTLERSGLARKQKIKTTGRPCIMWEAV